MRERLSMRERPAAVRTLYILLPNPSSEANPNTNFLLQKSSPDNSRTAAAPWLAIQILIISRTRRLAASVLPTATDPMSSAVPHCFGGFQHFEKTLGISEFEAVSQWALLSAPSVVTWLSKEVVLPRERNHGAQLRNNLWTKVEVSEFCEGGSSSSSNSDASEFASLKSCPFLSSSSNWEFLKVSCSLPSLVLSSSPESLLSSISKTGFQVSPCWVLLEWTVWAMSKPGPEDSSKGSSLFSMLWIWWWCECKTEERSFAFGFKRWGRWRSRPSSTTKPPSLDNSYTVNSKLIHTIVNPNSLKLKVLVTRRCSLERRELLFLKTGGMLRVYSIVTVLITKECVCHRARGNHDANSLDSSSSLILDLTTQSKPWLFGMQP